MDNIKWKDWLEFCRQQYPEQVSDNMKLDAALEKIEELEKEVRELQKKLIIATTEKDG